MKIALTVNGRPVETDVAPRAQLAELLRETLHLTGTHLGCEHGVCGACTVVINGETARACITYAVQCDGAEVRTIEGYDDDALMTRLRQVFKQEHALQCGYCTPGMLVAARDLIRRKGGLGEQAIRVEMSGNLCRCTGYVGIVRAIGRVMAERDGLLAGVEPAALHLGSLPASAVGRRGQPQASDPIAEPLREPRSPDMEVDANGSRASTQPPGPALSPWNDSAATRIEEQVRIGAPRATVRAFMADLGKVAGCIPGARLDLPPVGDTFAGTMNVKLGPIAVAFAGQGRVDRAPDGNSGTIEGQGRDGASSARARIRYALAEEGADVTRVDFSIAYALTGPLAQFSRGDLVRDLVRQIARAFAANIEAAIAGNAVTPAKPAELKAGRLLVSVLWSRLKRLLGFGE